MILEIQFTNNVLKTSKHVEISYQCPLKVDCGCAQKTNVWLCSPLRPRELLCATLSPGRADTSLLVVGGWFVLSPGRGARRYFRTLHLCIGAASSRGRFHYDVFIHESNAL